LAGRGADMQSPRPERGLNPQAGERIEDWLAQYTGRVTGLEIAEEVEEVQASPATSHRSRSVARRRNNGMNTIARTADSEEVKEPRMYTSIGDYLTHKGALSEAQRRTAAEEQHRIQKESTKRVNKTINDTSRKIVEKMRMRRIVELYDALDPAKLGYIDLTDIESTLDYLQPDEQQFLRGILEHYSQQGPTMDMEDFVAEMAVQMRKSTMGPLSALSARRSSHRAEETEEVVEQDRQQKFTFKPYVSYASAEIVEERRRNNGTNQLSVEERCTFLSNEKSMWGQRREALERRKEAEEMAQCTFTPEINSDNGNRKVPKDNYMKPLRTKTNILSTEEREVLQHCTFTPRTTKKRATSQAKSRPVSRATPQRRTPRKAQTPKQPRTQRTAPNSAAAPSPSPMGRKSAVLIR